jgi:hypothetical protein
MISKRKFNITVVNEKKGIGTAKDAKPDKVVSYTGEKIVIAL